MISKRNTTIESYNNTTYSSIEVPEICDDTVKDRTFLDGIYLGIAYTIGYIILSFTIKPVGREIILRKLKKIILEIIDTLIENIIIFIICTALLLFLGSAVGIALQFFSDPLAVILIFSCFLMFNGVCVTVINSTVVMIFPTQYRAMAVCCVLMSGRFGTIIGTNIVGQLLESNCVATFWSFTCVIICEFKFIFNIIVSILII